MGRRRVGHPDPSEDYSARYKRYHALREAAAAAPDAKLMFLFRSEQDLVGTEAFMHAFLSCYPFDTLHELVMQHCV